MCGQKCINARKGLPWIASGGRVQRCLWQGAENVIAGVVAVTQPTVETDETGQAGEAPHKRRRIPLIGQCLQAIGAHGMGFRVSRGLSLVRHDFNAHRQAAFVLRTEELQAVFGLRVAEAGAVQGQPLVQTQIAGGLQQLRAGFITGQGVRGG